MDQPAQRQAGDNRAALRREVGKYFFNMDLTVRSLGAFCNDMQAAVNELGQYDVRRYLHVTQTCDYLKDCMRAARQQSTIFIAGEQDHPDRIRNHISRMLEQVQTFRSHRNRITELYLRGTVCKNPEPWELELSLDKHMSLLRDDVQRLLDIANDKLQVGDDQPGGDVSGPSQLAPK